MNKNLLDLLLFSVIFILSSALVRFGRIANEQNKQTDKIHLNSIKNLSLNFACFFIQKW